MPVSPHARSEEYQLLIEHLTHEWVDFEDVISGLGDKIPPGKALRAYQEGHPDIFEKRVVDEDEGTFVYRMMDPPPLRSAASKGESAMISSGRRHLLNTAVHSAVGTGTVQMQRVPTGSKGKRMVRRNDFDADYISKIIADLKGDTTPQQPLVDKITSESDSSELEVVFDEPIYDLAFDHRSIKTILVLGKQKSGIVEVVIPSVSDTRDLKLFLVPRAADYLSDELAIQALVARRGEENPSKMVPPPH